MRQLNTVKDLDDMGRVLDGPALIEAIETHTVPFENPAAIDPGSLPATLRDVREFVSRHIAFPKEAHATAIAVWIAHTHAKDAFTYTPYLHVTSPVKRCGKSRLLDCLSILSANPWSVVSPTEAVLYRKIQEHTPTLLLDEVDTIFTAKGDDNKEALRALLNAGFERRATVPRCVGPQHTLVEFAVFCPKALAGIGKLPDTVSDRCIPITLARRAPGQIVEKFRARDAEPIGQPLAEAFRVWAENPEVIAALSAARPAIPDELGDRQADICEPLLAIADMAGEEWPEITRAALVELCTGEDAQDDSLNVKLLEAIRSIFTDRRIDRIPTQALLEALIARDNEEPWAMFWEQDMRKENTKGPASRLAKLLHIFGIRSGTIREEDGTTPKGYKLASFQDAFSRYLPQIAAQQRHNATNGSGA